MASNANAQRLTAAEGRALLAKKKPSKYHAKRVYVDGIGFASQREANRYCELKLLAKLGKVSDLQMQKAFEVTLNGVRCFKWLADFYYLDAKCARVIEDAKGFPTPVYKLKKKIIEAVYKIQIVEV